MRDISILGLTAKLILVGWLCFSVTAMALLGLGHTAAVWCSKYSTPANPACRAVDHLLEIEGH